MNGKTPYVRFDPDERDFWMKYTGLTALDREGLESAYKKSHEFILKNKDRLVENYGWEERHPEDKELFSLTSPEVRPVSGFRYTLPSTFSSFLDFESETWTTLFEKGFDVRRRHRSFDDLFISGPHPLSNIFYLLQCIAPGMLLLVRQDNMDGVGRIECVRALPSTSWVVEHEDILTTVLEDIGYQVLLKASRDDGKSCRELCFPSAFHSDHLAYGSNDAEYAWDYEDDLAGDDEDWNPDYTACGSDCGYCGHCEYD